MGEGPARSGRGWERTPGHPGAQRGWLGGFVLVGVVLAVGCATAPAWLSPEDQLAALLQASRTDRERKMNHEWQNHSFAELVKAKGAPRLLLDIPGGGNPPGFVMVYARDPATGCLDTFSMAYGPRTVVRSYQCR
jgi:hypothetical protein